MAAATGGALPAPRTIRGRFYRYQPIRYTTLGGSSRGGRYSPPAQLLAIYLGRPLESVAAEAYRHLVDPEDLDPAMVAAQRLFEVDVALARVLDLRGDDARESCGITAADLSGGYERGQALGREAFADGYQGVLAPSAAGLGETLCVFADRVAPTDLRVVDQRPWELPADPRPRT